MAFCDKSVQSWELLGSCSKFCIQGRFYQQTPFASAMATCSFTQLENEQPYKSHGVEEQMQVVAPTSLQPHRTVKPALCMVSPRL